MVKKSKICLNYIITLFKNADHKKRYDNDINERRIDGSDTEEIKQLLNEK